MTEDKHQQLNKCPLCGHQFSPDEADGRCESCPLSRKSCGMVKCPNCGYDFPVVEDPSLFSWAKKIFNHQQED